MNKILITMMCLTMGFQAAAETKIYKYTDAKGRVHFTDKKPFADAKEAELKSIVVIPSTSRSESTPSNRRRQERKQKRTAKQFGNFVISSPSDGVTLSGTGGNVLVKVNLEKELPSNYRIKFYLDQLPHGKVKSDSQLIADVARGEHSIYAEMIDANSRKVLMTTPKSTFFVKQHSVKQAPVRR